MNKSDAFPKHDVENIFSLLYFFFPGQDEVVPMTLNCSLSIGCGDSVSIFFERAKIYVTARSRSGLWLPTTEDRERTWRQSEIPQILL